MSRNTAGLPVSHSTRDLIRGSLGTWLYRVHLKLSCHFGEFMPHGAYGFEFWVQVLLHIADKMFASRLTKIDNRKKFKNSLKFSQSPPIQQLQIEFIGMLPSKNP
jgi:hypothetical protein